MPSKRQHDPSQHLRTCYVANIPYTATESDIRQLFVDFTVKRVSMILDRETKKFRGMAFVELANPDDAQEAVKCLDKSVLFNRELKVDIARERQPKPAGENGEDYERTWR